MIDRTRKYERQEIMWEPADRPRLREILKGLEDGSIKRVREFRTPNGITHFDVEVGDYNLSLMELVDNPRYRVSDYSIAGFELYRKHPTTNIWYRYEYIGQKNIFEEDKKDEN